MGGVGYIDAARPMYIANIQNMSWISVGYVLCTFVGLWISFHHRVTQSLINLKSKEYNSVKLCVTLWWKLIHNPTKVHKT